MQERFVHTLARATESASALADRPPVTPHRIPTPHPPVPSSSLPARFRPLTTAVVASRVRIAHGPASRRALRAVGRPAATLGNVVHLSRAPDGSAASSELLAHELVHAATAPARPRFFAEPGHDEEEERAMRIGRVARSMQQARVEPVRRVAAVPVAPRVVQRVEQAAPQLAAAQLAAPQQVAPAAVGADELIRRQPTIGSHRRRPTATPPATPPTQTQTPQQVQESGGRPTPAGPAPVSQRLNDFEELLDMLEQRVLNELERRGGSSRGGW
jgi:hypothetical protein